MINQMHDCIPGIAALVTERRGAEMKVMRAQTQRATLSKQLAAAFSSYAGRLQNRTTAPAKTLLEQEPLIEQAHHKRVTLFFCVKPGDSPVKIDLLRYMQLGLARESISLSHDSEAGTTIRQIAETFS